MKLRALSTEIPDRLAPLENRLAAVRVVRSNVPEAGRFSRRNKTESILFVFPPFPRGLFRCPSIVNSSPSRFHLEDEEEEEVEGRRCVERITINAIHRENSSKRLKCRPLLAYLALRSSLTITVSHEYALYLGNCARRIVEMDRRVFRV